MKISPYVKSLALLLIVAGIGAILFDSSPKAPIPLIVGLFTLLITTNKIEDERSVQIRTSSLYVAFILSYGAKLLIANLYDHNLLSFAFIEIDHFLILVLGLANAIYYGRLYILKF